MASMVTAWAVVLLLAEISQAAPGISFPINSQVPPVARVGQPFSFVFSPSTFSSSSSSAITYSLANSPSWLSVDSAARQLFGTPGEGDIGPGQVVGVPVSLVATDVSGSATLESTLVVSRSPGPRVNLPLERQVPRFGVFSSPSSILAAPQTQFSFSLATDTFLDPSNSHLSYYAVMTDNTPLPAWISFSSAGLTFSGQTPPSESLIQPPQRFGFQVVASDVVGFAAASLQFDIVVGKEPAKGDDVVVDKHQITADRTTISISATAGSSISYNGLRETIKVDGKPATAENAVIASVANAPSWLNVDKDTWAIGGAPPETAEPTSFVITVQEKISNTTLNLTIQIEVKGKESQAPPILKGGMPTLTTTSGESFSFDLGEHLENPSDTEMSVSTDPSATWVRFNAKTAIISGEVPSDFGDSSLSIAVQARSKSTGKTASLSITMRIRAATEPPEYAPPDVQPTTAVTTAIQQPTAHPTENSLASTTDDYAGAPPNLMLLAVLLPTFVIIASVTCLLFWCYRRRKEEKRPRLTTRDISGPLPGTFVRNDNYRPPIYGGDSGQGSNSSKQDTRGRGDSFQPSMRELMITEQKEYIELRNTYISNASIPRPQATVRLLPPIESSPSDADDVFGTGTVPLLTPIKPLRLTRHDMRNELRNDRSLSSISETSFYENNGTVPSSAGTNNDPTHSLLGPNNGAGTPFRDTVEVHIPTYNDNSIMQTPESAYMAPRSSPLSAAGSYVSFRGLNEGSRTQSRLGHYPQLPGNGSRKFAWPWLKKTINVGKAARSVPKHARKLSVATVDTFAYKRTTSTPPGPSRQDISPPSRMAKPTIQAVTDSSRPVTRRGPTPGHRQAWGAFSRQPTDAALPSSPTMGYAVLPSSPVAVAVSEAGAGWQRQQQHQRQPADSLGIMETPARGGNNNYEELVSGGPFHASKTWSSVGGDEWCDETVMSQSMASVAQPNWTKAGVSQSSPVVGQGLYLSGSKELGSELGSELLSPEKWPRAEAHGKGKAILGQTTGSGLGKLSVSQGLSLASEGSPRFL